MWAQKVATIQRVSKLALFTHSLKFLSKTSACRNCLNWSLSAWKALGSRNSAPSDNGNNCTVQFHWLRVYCCETRISCHSSSRAKSGFDRKSYDRCARNKGKKWKKVVLVIYCALIYIARWNEVKGYLYGTTSGNLQLIGVHFARRNRSNKEAYFSSWKINWEVWLWVQFRTFSKEPPESIIMCFRENRDLNSRLTLC